MPGKPHPGIRYGGRAKGTPNKNTQTLKEKAEELGVDPFEILLMFAKGDWKGLGYEAETKTCFTAAGIEFEELIIKPEQRVKAAAEACQYLFPKRKAIEVSGTDGGPIETKNVIDPSTLSTEELTIIGAVLEGATPKNNSSV